MAPRKDDGDGDSHTPEACDIRCVSGKFWCVSGELRASGVSRRAENAGQAEREWCGRSSGHTIAFDWGLEPVLGAGIPTR